MDLLPDNLQIRPIHAGEMPRLRRSVFPVRTIGYLPHKEKWVDRAFDSMNFSFILGGGGFYHCHGQRHAIEPPCVVTQWPGRHVRYGPGGGWGAWHELYLIYPAALAPQLALAQLSAEDSPLWPIEDIAGVRESLEHLATLSRQPSAPGWIEEVDLACEQLIMRSRPLASSTDDPELRRIVSVKKEIEGAFFELACADEVAVRHGLSRSTFRRLWSRICEVPPQRYLTALKLRHASRLLVETRLPIGEVGMSVGFADPFYFSRKFKSFFGLTAKDYRRQHQMDA